MEPLRDTELRRDLTYITGIMNGDIEIDSQFIGMSQNTPVSVSDSPPPPHLKLKMHLLQKENGALTLV